MKSENPPARRLMSRAKSSRGGILSQGQDAGATTSSPVALLAAVLPGRPAVPIAGGTVLSVPALAPNRLTPDQLCQYMGWTRRTYSRRCRKGQIPPYFLDGSRKRFMLAEVERWQAARTVRAGK